MKVIVKRLLKQFGYPSDMEILATETVLKQAELIAAEPNFLVDLFNCKAKIIAKVHLRPWLSRHILLSSLAREALGHCGAKRRRFATQSPRRKLARPL